MQCSVLTGTATSSYVAMFSGESVKIRNVILNGKKLNKTKIQQLLDCLCLFSPPPPPPTSDQPPAATSGGRVLYIQFFNEKLEKLEKRYCCCRCCCCC